MSPYHPGMAQTTIWTGDPVWIADVLAAQGVKLVEYPGWRNRGHGNFKDIRGVMVHHTGSDSASAASIANGRPDLAGPLSQLHIARIGTGSGTAPTPRPPVPIGVYADVLLFRGSQGPQVAELQRQLGVTVDGDFGSQAEAAVRAIQRRTPGLKVDGIIGPATAAAMRLNVLPPSRLLLTLDDAAS